MNKQDKKTALDALICKKELKFGIFFDGTGNHREFNFIKTQFLLKKHPLTNLSQNADIDPKRHTSLLSQRSLCN